MSASDRLCLRAGTDFEPLEDQRPFITVQSTATCAFPALVRNAGEMISDFGTRGYELVDRWMAPELDVLLPFFPNPSLPRYSGFYSLADSVELRQHSPG
jgi:hypothetical protein